MLIANNIRNVRKHIPAHVRLVCVSKFQSVEAIREAYNAGERHFGESRVQELKAKMPLLPADIRWHFIGHLQTNKVRDLLKLRPYLIHSVDSEHLLKAINDEALKQGFVQDVLLEVHVARETTKSGFTPEELNSLMGNGQMANFSHVCVKGLMAMATNTDDETEIRRCFTMTKTLYDQINGHMVNVPMVNLSMGMSDDYRIAIECGSTMVRIGSSIFGERNHSYKLKAVFFDQDGVLFDSMPYHAKSWVLAMTEYGFPFSEKQVYRNEGRTGSSVIREAGGNDDDCEKIYKAKSRYFNQLTGGKLPELIPNIRDVLTFLHNNNIQCWVVTGSGQRSLLDNLNTTFPDVFSGVISAYDVTQGKPSPEPYIKAWERSGFKKEECFVVENAPLGVRAGKAAGLFTIAVNTGPLPDSELLAEGADCVLPNMKVLVEFLQKTIKNQ